MEASEKRSVIYLWRLFMCKKNLKNMRRLLSEQTFFKPLASLWTSPLLNNGFHFFSTLYRYKNVNKLVLSMYNIKISPDLPSMKNTYAYI